MAVVVKNEGAGGRANDEVVVGGWLVVGFRGVGEPACHSEMKLKVGSRVEVEKESLAVSMGADERVPGEGAPEKRGRGIAEDAGARVKVGRVDSLPEAGIPQAAAILDFGQLGHGEDADSKDYTNPKLNLQPSS